MGARVKEFHSKEVDGKRTGVGTIVDRWLREHELEYNFSRQKK